MKFTISRKKYDTENDMQIAVVCKSFGEYGQNPDDDWTEALYKKSNNEYYMYGAGGKNTPFSDAGGHVVVWPKNNFISAKSWVRDNCPDKLKEFTEDGEKLQVTTISITQKAKQNLKRYSNEHGLSVSEIIRQFAESLYE